jgi:DNA-binding response OmpR family regulator
LKQQWRTLANGHKDAPSLEIDRCPHRDRHGALCELTSYQFRPAGGAVEPPAVLSRDQIMEAVANWRHSTAPSTAHGRIRGANRADPKDPKRILTVRGVHVRQKQD